MKRAIDVLPCPSDGYAPFKLDVKAPGLVRAVLTAYAPPSTIIAASLGKPPEAEMRPIPSIMFEIDPEAESVVRNFVWLPAGKALEFPGRLEFRATYVDEPTGMPLILYEALPD